MSLMKGRCQVIGWVAGNGAEMHPKTRGKGKRQRGDDREKRRVRSEPPLHSVFNDLCFYIRTSITERSKVMGEGWNPTIYYRANMYVDTVRRS